MDGIPLASRFSIATNRINYCGPSEAAPALYRAIVSGHGDEEARRALEGFEALWPYLEAIGAKHHLDPLDEKVVEAYWIGNELLDDFGREDFRSILTALTRRGLPPSVAERLIAHLPQAPIPHHMFHVAFVGVGAVTGHVPTTLANLESCRPAFATVHARGTEVIHVLRPSLVAKEGRLVWGSIQPEKLRFDPAVLGEVTLGQEVVLHWGWPALVLNPARADALRRFTDRSLAAANESLPDMGVFP